MHAKIHRYYFKRWTHWKVINLYISKPGERCIFTGCLTPIPDVASLLKSGERAEIHQRGETIRKNINNTMDGVSGLK